MGRKLGADMSDDEPRRLVFYKEDIELIAKVLTTMLGNTQARCILLVDKEGHLITREGESPTHDMDTISALVAGSFAAVRQMARLLGEKGYSIMFQKSDKDNIQLFLVGERTLMAVIFDDRKSRGLLRLYAEQVAAKLTELFKEIADRGRE